MVLSGWSQGFGFSIYAYEGIGIILPVQAVTKDPDNYFKIVASVILFVAFMFISFGLFCSYIWQTGIESIITQ